MLLGWRTTTIKVAHAETLTTEESFSRHVATTRKTPSWLKTHQIHRHHHFHLEFPMWLSLQGRPETSWFWGCVLSKIIIINPRPWAVAGASSQPAAVTSQSHHRRSGERLFFHLAFLEEREGTRKQNNKNTSYKVKSTKNVPVVGGSKSPA